MKIKYQTAVELLMSYPESVVAEMMGMQLCTLKRWMERDDFCDTLRRREREQKSTLARIARQAAVNAASSLCQVASNTEKPDAKVLIEVLKLSGAFTEEAEDPGAALAEVMRKVQAKVDARESGRE